MFPGRPDDILRKEKWKRKAGEFFIVKYNYIIKKFSAVVFNKPHPYSPKTI